MWFELRTMTVAAPWLRAALYRQRHRLHGDDLAHAPAAIENGQPARVDNRRDLGGRVDPVLEPSDVPVQELNPVGINPAQVRLQQAVRL